MTDDTTDPIDPRDELASAHVDGMTSADEAAEVAADSDLGARVERLAAARRALRSADVAALGTPDDERRRDAGIAAALAAFDEQAPLTATATDLRPVPSLRRRAAVEAKRTWQLVGIAAAVLLLALAVPLLGSLDDTSDDEEDSAATEAAPDESSAERATESASPMAGDDDAGATEAFAGLLPRLGSFDDLDQLTTALHQQRTAASTGAAEASTSAPATAGDELAVEPAAAPCAAVGPDAEQRWQADLDGQEVVVLVSDQPDGAASVIVLEAIGCAVVARTDLPPTADG